MLNFLFKFNFILSIFSSFIAVNLNYNFCYGVQDDGRPSRTERPESLSEAYPASVPSLDVDPVNTMPIDPLFRETTQRLDPRGGTDGNRTCGEKVKDNIGFEPKILATQEELRGQRILYRNDSGVGEMFHYVGMVFLLTGLLFLCVFLELK